MKYETYLLTSLDTVFTDSEISEDNLKYTSFCRNEAFSFQVVLKPEATDKEEWFLEAVEVRAEVICELKASVYTVENVPATRIGYSISDDWFLRKNSGIYPDRLEERSIFTVPASRWKSVWININEECESIEPGKYNFTIKFYDRRDDSLIAEKTLELKVLDAELKKQKIMTTNWIHYDCIAHFSKTEPFTEEFMEVAEKYIRLAAKNGQNMILTPVFTPPLDTPVGEERATVQLVSVKKENGKYFFDFHMLKEFIERGIKCGAEYFEHSHLYSQWGAGHAPKIVVSENGENKKMFGWDTDAHGVEYREFLHEYLTALKKFMKENDYEKRFFFHVSDEPDEKHLESYKKASDFIHEELAGYPSGDALCDKAYSDAGLVDIPIAVTNNIEDFLDVKPRWAYHTGGQSFEHLSNRIIGMPRERGRILGVQLYYFDIDGFLNWGFNAHHNRLSRRIIDPRISSDMDTDFVSGTSYLVYPNEKDVDPSVRLLTYRDHMQDTRAFELLEEKIGRDAVLGVIRKHIPNISFRCKVSKEQVLDLREEVNKLLSE